MNCLPENEGTVTSALKLLCVSVWFAAGERHRQRERYVERFLLLCVEPLRERKRERERERERERREEIEGMEDDDRFYSRFAVSPFRRFLFLLWLRFLFLEG